MANLSLSLKSSRLVLIGCYVLVLVESGARWVSSTAKELSRGGSALIERVRGSKVQEEGTAN
ncbi:hypothetical protein F2Q68_00013340 [Brassica cretica]|uniref:Uncharacterized protein n=1 Tax=Brassica cretica TaxID=69181 RepID=A0A8S9HAF5_BRACR|nr:hypothetical protein F2Q68_00013340 [Brassica cretica]